MGMAFLYVCIILVIVLIFKTIHTESTKDINKVKHLLEKLTPLFEENLDKNDSFLVKLKDPNFRNKISVSVSSKSTTINKNKIYLCIKNKNNEYYTDNILIYVLLHELSHSISSDVGHTKQFQDIFSQLLQKAEKHKLYDPNIPFITDYCT